jgi:hypothetical protein
VFYQLQMSLSAIMFFRLDIKRRHEVEGIKLKEKELAAVVGKEWSRLSKGDQQIYETTSKTTWSFDPNFEKASTNCYNDPNYHSDRNCTEFNCELSTYGADLPILKAARPTRDAQEAATAQPQTEKRIMAGQLAKQISQISCEDTLSRLCTGASEIDSINASSAATVAALRQISGYETESDLQKAIVEYGFKALHANDAHSTDAQMTTSSHGNRDTDATLSLPAEWHSTHHPAGERSQFYHVHHDPYRPGKWKTYLHLSDGRRQFFGPFDTDEEAARAHDALARLEFGEAAKTNFDHQGNRILHSSRPYQPTISKKMKKRKREGLEQQAVV